MTRSFSMLLTLLALVSLMSSGRPAFAAEVTGTWKLTATAPNGSQTAFLKLAQTGTRLSGTFSDGSHEMPIQEGTFKGSNLQFKLASKRGQDTFKLHVDGDRMKGTWQGGMGTFNLTAVRQRTGGR